MYEPNRRPDARSEQKVRLAAEALQRISGEKQRQGAWGQVCIKLFWESGTLKMVEITDTTTIKDVPSTEAIR